MNIRWSIPNGRRFWFLTAIIATNIIVALVVSEVRLAIRTDRSFRGYEQWMGLERSANRVELRSPLSMNRVVESTEDKDNNGLAELSYVLIRQGFTAGAAYMAEDWNEDGIPEDLTITHQSTGDDVYFTYNYYKSRKAESTDTVLVSLQNRLKPDTLSLYADSNLDGIFERLTIMDRESVVAAYILIDNGWVPISRIPFPQGQIWTRNDEGVEVEVEFENGIWREKTKAAESE